MKLIEVVESRKRVLAQLVLCEYFSRC